MIIVQEEEMRVDDRMFGVSIGTTIPTSYGTAQEAPTRNIRHPKVL